MKQRYMVVALGVLATLAAAGTAAAQSAYPQRSVRLIVPFAPGGASDFVGRIVAARLSDELGQQVVVDNRGGAAGNIGMTMAAQAQPDGYTLYQGNIGTLAINPNLYHRTLKVLPVRDFAPVGQQVDVPGALVVHPSLPVKTVKELIALGKKRPGELNFGSAGGGSANRLEMEIFMRAAGIDMVHVPYKGGAGPAAIGLMGGETSLMFVTLSSVVNFVKDGRMRALAVVAPRRVDVLPNVPTMAEEGFGQMTTGSWQGLLAPAGTPKPVIDRLFAALTKTMADADVRKRLAAGGVGVVTSESPEAFRAFMQSESERFAKVIKDANIRVE